jgi:2'-5' RNA ligase
MFVALSLPEEVRAEVERAQSELRGGLERARVTWTRREQFHLTLKFLGDVEAGRAGALIEAVRAACRAGGALRLRAEGVGCFPDLRRPRVVWVGVKDAGGALGRLQRAVETACGAFAAELNRFSGHVTLCRIKSLARPEADGLARQVQAMAARSFGEWTAGEVEVMRSELSPQGARHSVLAGVPLGGG